LILTFRKGIFDPSINESEGILNMSMQNYCIPALARETKDFQIDPSQLPKAIEEVKGECYYGAFDAESLTKPYGKLRPALNCYVLDFDAEQLEDAKNEVIKVWKFLNLSPRHARIFFSGNKGFHLYLHHSLLNLPSSAVLNTQVKAWAKGLERELSLKTLDMSVFAPTQKMRLPRSKHPKSGLYKTEITFETLQLETISNIKLAATRQSPCSIADLIASDAPLENVPNSPAPEIIGSGIFGTENLLTEEYPVFKESLCIQKMWDTNVGVGHRHEAYKALIQDAKDCGRSEHDLQYALNKWAILNNCEDRLDTDIKRVVEAVYHGSGFKFGCYTSIKANYCSAHCKIFQKLDVAKRANPSDIKELSARPTSYIAKKHTEILAKMESITDPKELKKAEKEKEAIERKLERENERLARKEERALEKKEERQARKKEYQENLPVSGFKEWGEKGPKCTIGNIKHMLSELGIEIRYDVIKKDLALLIPNSRFLIDTEKNDKMNHIVSQAISCDMNYGKVEDFVAYIASQNPYNPVAEWIDSKAWDGTSRVQSFYDTAVAKKEYDPKVRGLKETLMKRWMVSAIAAAYLPNGVSAHGVLVFTAKQYIGKTNWALNLAPRSMKVVKDGATLDPKDKDSTYESLSHWIVELGELDATFKKADIAQLKAFIPKTHDSIRLPYRREPAKFARRTVFFGSVNDKDYLNDPTGNRRFWTIELESLNHSHNLDMQQVWAEFKHMFDQGEAWFLSPEEMTILNEHNEDFMVKDPIEEKLAVRIKFGSDKATFKTTTQIAELIGFQNPKHGDQIRIGRALGKMGFERKQHRLGGSVVWGYFIDLNNENNEFTQDEEVVPAPF
jgi:putative DNA primase/helicase